MKKLFTILAVAATLVSCAKEDVVREAEGEAIQFGNAFVDNATRADYSTDKINTINVYGTVNNVLIYDYTPVKRDNKEYNTPWTCDVVQYWVKGASYKFAALVDVPKENIDFDGYGMPKSFTYTADGTTDVLYDYNVATGQAKGSNSTVAFTFKHLLAKAHFTVKNNVDHNDYTYTISDVKVTNTLPSGTYTVYTVEDGTGTWSSSATPSYTTFASIENVAYNTPQTNADILLIPGANVGVSFNVTLKIGGKDVTTYNYEKTGVATLAQNTVYNFDVVLQPNDTIQFTVSEQPEWTTPTTNVPLQ